MGGLLAFKGVLFINQLVLGDSLVTVSSVKGLVYTEVDVNFRQICRW